MNLIIRMNLDNAAFVDDGLHEVKRAIDEALDALANVHLGQIGADTAIIRDLNGNNVGQLTITEF